MQTFNKMLKIEGRLSIRDMNMVIFALVMPAVVLILLGVVYGTQPATTGAEYSFIEQSFGALCSIAICAGGLMGLPILISEYRERKILKRFQVTPISSSMILMVHLTIYTLYAAASVVILWLLSVFFFKFKMQGSYLSFLVGWLLVVVSIFSIGVLVGGLAKNSKQASVIASILYFPMLIFSGATLPYEVMPVGMQKVVDLMPLTQGIKILKAAVLGESLTQVGASIGVMLAMALICMACSIKYFRWE